MTRIAGILVTCFPSTSSLGIGKTLVRNKTGKQPPSEISPTTFPLYARLRFEFVLLYRLKLCFHVETAVVCENEAKSPKLRPKVM